MYGDPWLEEHDVPFSCIFGSPIYREKYLTLSHRWQTQHHPDPWSLTLETELCLFLHEHPAVELLLIPTCPQGRQPTAVSQ